MSTTEQGKQQKTNPPVAGATTGPSSDQKEKTAKFNMKIGFLKRRLRDVSQNIKSITDIGRLAKSDATHLSEFRAMYKRLDSNYDTFQGLWNELLELYFYDGRESEFPSKTDSTLQQSVERYYYESCAIHIDLEELRKESNATLHAQTFQNESSAPQKRSYLPRIDIPKFDGNFDDWPIFRDTFKSIVHDDPSIGNIEKYHHLITSLSGPSLSLVKSIPLLGENYDQAWEALTNVYDDPRRLANNYLQQVIDFKPLQGKPSIAALRTYITSIIENIQSLQNLKVPNLDEFILFTLAIRCLDKNTRELYEAENVEVKYPSFKSLGDFVRKRCRVLDISSTLDQQPLDNKPPKSTNLSKSTRKPPLPKTNYSQSFVATRAKNYESKTSANNIKSNFNFPRRKTQTHSQQQTSPNREQPFKQKPSGTLSCCICEGIHTLSVCPIFICASSSEKAKLIENINVCQNCLFVGHSLNECRSSHSCRICNKRHHTTLHTEPTLKSNSTLSQQSSSGNVPSSKTTALTSIAINKSDVLLGTARALIKDVRGDYQPIRLLVDSASQHSFITRKCVKKLGLELKEFARVISGLNQSVVHEARGKVTCILRPFSHLSLDRERQTEALVVPEISSYLPHSPLPENLINKYLNQHIADPEFWKPGPVDMLLGADLYCDIITGIPICLNLNEPNILPTIFGNILIGPYQSDQPNKSTTVMTTTANSSQNQASTDDSVTTMLKKFWELEEPSIRELPMCKEDQYCEDLFSLTTQRTKTGRYMVMLPFKTQSIDLGESKQRALSRLFNLEVKLSKNPIIKNEYINFMNEYAELDHMTKADSVGEYYIPHHSIIKTVDSSIKLRVVFDCSAKASKGSLNDILLQGPKLQQDIGDIILLFRTNKVAFTTDIKKMYRQILIDPSCYKYLHILWRDDPSAKVRDFILKTLTYGLNCAPFLALRVLRQLVTDEGHNYPRASRAILEETYIDDIPTGAQTVKEALELKKQLIELLAKGGFELSKWSSNSPELLSPDSANELVSLTEDEHVKILGFQWNPKGDSFSYSLQPISTVITKRSILSTVARIYDPLGFLSPVIFCAKHIIQAIWIGGSDWDEPVPNEISKRWAVFTEQLPILCQLQIPRFILTESPNNIELVGFADASTKGFCGALYARVSTDNSIKTFLIKSKTKLAPIKTITVPRLELCAALLLARLVQSVNLFISRLKINNFTLFTDSQTVLSWLRIAPNKLKVFVANRITEILELTNIDDWKHVPSEENPADLGSRGLLPNEIINKPLWWFGPPWITQPNSNWPPSIPISSTDLPELKEISLPLSATLLVESNISEQKDSLCDTSSVNAEEFIPDPLNNTNPRELTQVMQRDIGEHRIQPFELSSPELVLWMETYSSYPKLIRTIGYVLRAIRKTNRKSHLSITANEFQAANIKCIKLVQAYYLSDLSKPGSKLERRLSPLAPFTDTQGIVRIGGRLRNAKISLNAKHPILLPQDSPFTKLLIQYYHKLYLHLGPSALQTILQTRYWIPSARRMIRTVIHECLTCFKFSASPQPPIMADLPSSRFSEGSTFNHTGVDFCGPFICKESLRKKSNTTKAYVCLFICLSVKAIHLEVVPSLSTPDFLDALDRFIARRGKPSLIVSDCGTNFMGAANYIKEVAEWFQQNDTRTQIINHVTHQGVEWTFSPPRAPHFGGLWEAGVKQAKTLFKKIIGTQNFSKDELTTIFTKIESVLNSRPIGPSSLDPNDPSPLTPGHFLIGKPLLAMPEPGITEINENRLVRWQLVQQRTQEFWNRWRLEYLQTLQRRSKWLKSTTNLSIGDTVLLIEDHAPPLHWPTGIIIKVYPGKDGIVRVADVKTTKGTYKRPIIKLVSLVHILQPTSLSKS